MIGYLVSSIKPETLLKETQPIPKEQEFVAQLKAKDRKSFALLYDRYSAALYGVIFRIVQLEEMADDVLQDSFVKIWKNIESYNAEKGTLFTWILNIARNTAIDKTRSQDFKIRMKTKPLEGISVDKQTSIRTEVEHIGLNKVVDNLKPEYKEVIDIIYFKGYTHTEAAEELKLPLGTVKTRVKIALRELRKLIFN